MIGTALGIFIVLGIGIFLYNLISKDNKNGDVSVPGVSHEVETTNKKIDNEYIVIEGDSLWKISIKLYNNGYKWSEIYKLNKNIIVNPDKIYPGMKLRLQNDKI